MAIGTIAAVLEQKVWILTSSEMYPNLYTFLVGEPGAGKSRAMDLARDMISAMPDPFIAPTSVNAASIIDHLKECKRVVIRLPDPPVEYNSMAIIVGEFGTFMSKFEDDLMALLTDFYNVRPYSQRRRGQGGLKIEIARPQLNMLVGTTPSNLMKFMPDVAWGQGFASRIIFVYSDEKGLVDDFAGDMAIDTTDLVHDLGIINSLAGQFSVTDEYRNCINLWRGRDENDPPKPTHPRLQHYNSRRKEHLYRLSMVSSIDRSDALILGKEDFLRAMSWLLEAEQFMPRIFDTGSGSTDSVVMDELLYLIKKKGGMTEDAVLRYIRQRVPAHSVVRVMDVMIDSGMLKVVDRSRFGVRSFNAGEIA